MRRVSPRQRARDLRDTFVLNALEYVGYTAQADKNSQFGTRVGHPNRAWSGSFVDVVARESGLALTSCVYPPAALAEFFHVRRIHEKPQQGDLVFFAASSDAAFGSPMVGIVVDTSGWKTDGRVSVIAGQVSTGLRRGSQESNGVYRRDYYLSDIICFARPDFRAQTPEPPETGSLRDMEEFARRQDLPVLAVAHFAHGHRGSSKVELLQTALAAVLTGVTELERGSYDAKTRSAYARYQRSIGYVGSDRANGLPDTHSLTRLGEMSGLFRV